MIEEIKNELVKLEDQKEIKILLAVESESRAWGFASTDSDWEVRYNANQGLKLPLLKIKHLRVRKF